MSKYSKTRANRINSKLDSLIYCTNYLAFLIDKSNSCIKLTEEEEEARKLETYKNSEAEKYEALIKIFPCLEIKAEEELNNE